MYENLIVVAAPCFLRVAPAVTRRKKKNAPAVTRRKKKNAPAVTRRKKKNAPSVTRRNFLLRKSNVKVKEPI